MYITRFHANALGLIQFQITAAYTSLHSFRTTGSNMHGTLKCHEISVLSNSHGKREKKTKKRERKKRWGKGGDEGGGSMEWAWIVCQNNWILLVQTTTLLCHAANLCHQQWLDPQLETKRTQDFSHAVTPCNSSTRMWKHVHDFPGNLFPRQLHVHNWWFTSCWEVIRSCQIHTTDKNTCMV